MGVVGGSQRVMGGGGRWLGVIGGSRRAVRGLGGVIGGS